MIEEIKKRLEAGEVVELECVDRGGFLKDKSRREANEKILDQGLLAVDYIDYDGDIRLVGGIVDIYLNVIVSGEFKYFRIKESSATFDDLIDIAVKAYKDGRIDNLELTKGVDGGAGVRINSNRQFTNSRPLDGINFINSLYTETFVIESEGDMCKFNNDIDSIILANSEDIIDIVMFNRNEPYFTNGGASAVKVPFSVLKGATVTQKRGKQ